MHNSWTYGHASKVTFEVLAAVEKRGHIDARSPTFDAEMNVVVGSPIFVAQR
jgi:hypothetical protein